MNNIVLLEIFGNPVNCAFNSNYTCRDATIEILLMLLLAALLGFLLRHLLGKTTKKEIIRDNNYSNSTGNNKLSITNSNEYKALLEENKKLKLDLDNCRKNNISNKSNLKSSDYKTTKKSSIKTNTKTSGSKKDDLKVVEGIGPAIEKLLNNNSIFTYSELASSEISTLERILDEAGPRFRVHVPETWTEQAKLLRDGKMAEFEKLTEELKGGRRK